jgi:hypothetical protein
MTFVIVVLAIVACRTEPPAASEPRSAAFVDAAVAAAPPASGQLEVIPLRTGTAFRFKGLAIDKKRAMAYLGSWDQKAIVAVDLAKRSHRVVATKYNGKLNGMDVFLRGDTLYAVMNEVDDAPGARARSVLLMIGVDSLAVMRSYELRAIGARHHFNHVVVDAAGRAYITDTLHGAIHTVDTTRADASIERLVEHPELELVHGIDLSEDGTKLALTSYRSGIRFFDLKLRRLLAYVDRKTAGDDGLKYHRGALYAVGQNKVRRHVLNATGDAVVRTEVVLADHELFNDPRCLQVEGDRLYVLANIEHEPVEFAGGRKGRAQTDTHVIELRL